MLFSLLTIIYAQNVSKDGRCGKEFGDSVCSEEVGGKCCSQYGYCGNTADHCGSGCQSGCVLPKPMPSPELPKCGDGTCDNNIETCYNCPGDCGKCDMEYIDKCKQNGMISLTFDDGPTEFSPILLDILKKHNVKATFFYIGEKLANRTLASYALRAFREGHTIASHTFTHPHLTKLTDQQIRFEMKQTDDNIYKIIAKRPIFMRNPYADMDDRVLAILQPSLGYESIFTSLDTEDTEVAETQPEKIYTNVVNGLKYKSPNTSTFIITQHETFLQSINYVPKIISHVLSKGYNIVPLNACRGLKASYKK